jgi:uncharacterized protein (DUF2235 family)
MAAMAQKIVICSDGTGNSFSEQVSNVTRLVKLLDLTRPKEQAVFYDQGIGTDPALVDAVQLYKNQRASERCALTVLDPPLKFPPLRAAARLIGLGFGYGLKRNVRELYKALADAYEDGPPDTRSVIYLFGFSRGAFTVRVLAGLMHRCGLLRANHPHYAAAFNEAYDLYTPHTPDGEAIAEFKDREHVVSPCVKFLGIWDTVKSYGGIWPQSLPHLRRNPSVECVRHALALDEQRSWFLPTSWSGIDSDPPPLVPAKGCQPQDVEEIWFRGSHSDVGGGLEDDTASRAPLRWMLNEAASAGLELSEEGWNATTRSDPDTVTPFPSLTRGWLVSEYIPRWELDNHFQPPKRYFKCGRSGQRHPAQFSRQQVVWLHSSVGPEHDIVAEYAETRIATPPGSGRGDTIAT